MLAVSESAWNLIENLLPRSAKLGRPREHSLRSIVEGIFFVVKSGCHWRLLPEGYPPWQTVYSYFARWRGSRILYKILDVLRAKSRQREGKADSRIALVDSQSVKSGNSKASKGFDGHKRVKGRKRHFVFDSSGHLVRVMATKANRHDKGCARLLLSKSRIKSIMPNLREIHADGAYVGLPVPKGVELVLTGSLGKGFIPVPLRWKAERSISWLSGYRRLSKDYETLCRSSEEMVVIAWVMIMLKRLTGEESF